MAGMKKKDAAKWLGDMIDSLELTDIEVTGDMETTRREAEALACGLIAGIVEAKMLLEYGPYGDTPRKQALSSLGDTINSYEKARRDNR